MIKRLRNAIGAGVILAVASCSASSPAMAQQSCAPTETVYEALEVKFGETRVAAGVTESGAAIEMWASVETDTWTMIITRTDGMSCLVADGIGWNVDKPPDGDPA